MNSTENTLDWKSLLLAISVHAHIISYSIVFIFIYPPPFFFRLERKGYRIWRHGHCHWLEFGRHRHWGPPDWSCRRLSFAASPWIWRWGGEKEHENEDEDEDGWGLRTLAWDTTAFRDEERNQFPALVSPQLLCQSFPLWIGQKGENSASDSFFLLFLFGD